MREVGSSGLAGKGNWGGAAAEMEGNPGQKSAVKSTRGRSSKTTECCGGMTKERIGH